MKKPLKSSWLRTLIPVVFILFTVVGTIWHTGWGTLSSFGWKEIAAICPLGALETMLAEKTILPRALAALAVFFVLVVFFGRFFCGWLCPVPSVSRLLQFLKTGGRRREKEEDVAEEDTQRQIVLPAQPTQDKHAETCGISSCAGCSSCSAGEAVKKTAAQKRQAADAGPLTVLAGALASSAVFGFPVFCLICPVGLTFAVVIALSRLFQFNESGWEVLIFAAFLVLELLVLRRWCRNFCPLGALIGLMSRLNRLFVPRINPKACVHATHGVDCRICADACPEGIDLRRGKLTSADVSVCIKCRACAEVCPSRAVSFPLLPSSPFVETAPMPARGRIEIVPVAERLVGYEEVRRPLDIREAVRQSSRCLRCGRCTSVCPQGNRVSQWMALLSRGDVDGAARLMLQEGALPEICGRVCPSERFCERVCSMQEAEGAVMIPDIERAVSQYALDHGFKPGIRRARVPAKAAVIGAGPAGLACADYLARRGVNVTVYDKERDIGGLLSYGIPPFKLSRDVVARRRALLNELGVKLVMATTLGKELDFESIRRQNDAVFVATGAGCAVGLSVPGGDLPGVLPAMVLLGAVSRRALGESNQMPDVKGKRVVVLGGGDTAVDCLRCAIREGAASATAVARKPREALRAMVGELQQAQEEGAEILCGLQVERLVSAGGIVSAVLCRDGDGKELEVPADVVFVAYGFRPEPIPWLAGSGVAFDNAGRICVDDNNATNVAGIYAGGDAVRGAAFVSTAVADGRRAARAILRYCSIA